MMGLWVQLPEAASLETAAPEDRSPGASQRVGNFELVANAEN